MRAITRQAVTRDRIILDSDTFKVAIDTAAVTGITEAQVKVVLETAAKEELHDLHVHRNRDGSIAIAVGEAPKVWPEDEKGLPEAVK